MKFLGNSLFLIIIIITFGCSREEARESIRPVAIDTRAETSLSAKQIATIGRLHNEHLGMMFERFNYRASDPEQELRRQFNNLVASETGYTGRKAGRLANHLRNAVPDPRSLLRDRLSSTARGLWYEVESAAGYPTVGQVGARLNQVKSKVEAKLKGLERYALLVGIEVVRKSAERWMDHAAGGQGLYEEVQEGLYGRKIVRIGDKLPTAPYSLYANTPDGSPSCLREVLVADGLAASAYFLGIGLGLAIPGANLGIVVSLGFYSAWASGVTALREC